MQSCWLGSKYIFLQGSFKPKLGPFKSWVRTVFCGFYPIVCAIVNLVFTTGTPYRHYFTESRRNFQMMQCACDTRNTLITTTTFLKIGNGNFGKSMYQHVWSISTAPEAFYFWYEAESSSEPFWSPVVRLYTFHIFFSRTALPFSTKHGTKHSFVKRDSNLLKWRTTPRGAYSEIVKIFWQHWKSAPEAFGQF